MLRLRSGHNVEVFGRFLHGLLEWADGGEGCWPLNSEQIFCTNCICIYTWLRLDWTTPTMRSTWSDRTLISVRSACIYIWHQNGFSRYRLHFNSSEWCTRLQVQSQSETPPCKTTNGISLFANSNNKVSQQWKEKWTERFIQTKLLHESDWCPMALSPSVNAAKMKWRFRFRVLKKLQGGTEDTDWSSVN